MKKRLIGLLVVITMILITVPRIEAIEQNDIIEKNKHVFGLCYLENTKPGEYDPTEKVPYIGGITMLCCGPGSHTSVYDHKGGIEIASFNDGQIVITFLLIGYHQQMETSCTYAGNAIGVFVIGG